MTDYLREHMTKTIKTVTDCMRTAGTKYSDLKYDWTPGPFVNNHEVDIKIMAVDSIFISPLYHM